MPLKKEDAIRRGEPSLVSDPFLIRPAGRTTPVSPRTRGSLMKLLTFSKAAESPMADFPSERRVTGSAWAIAAAVAGAALVVAAFFLVPRWRPKAALPQVGQLAVVSEPS